MPTRRQMIRGDGADRDSEFNRTTDRTGRFSCRCREAAIVSALVAIVIVANIRVMSATRSAGAIA